MTALTPETDALATLAELINKAHTAVIRSLRTSVGRAIAVGELLHKAHKQVRYGQWENWVKTKTHISPRMASNYMRLAQLSAEDRKRVSELGVRGALDAIAEAKPPTTIEVEVTESTLKVPVIYQTVVTKTPPTTYEPPAQTTASEEHTKAAEPAENVVRGRFPRPSVPPKPGPPLTREEIADDLIAELARAFHGVRDDVGIEDLRAAFERRWPRAKASA